MKLKLLGLTFLGGAIGSALRYLISVLVTTGAQDLWIVNLLGALVLGFVQTSRFTKSEQAQALLGTGFAGGFTTVSGLLVFALFAPTGDFLMVSAQVAIGIVFFWLGRVLGGDRTWSKS